ncbi:alpha-crystallin domain-containing protein 22.3 isoform X2 [Capsicum annuum]|uniref:alpha-crystallin domain-containing protein 22.3 isoform X2 n=1 Tax=Capsicum annuum TaxID=4072 RepID=UPI001FB0A750|nr:alpha-crystallin domain-containing protein 22.3 isoform X2 [Capsicum annuum]
MFPCILRWIKVVSSKHSRAPSSVTCPLYFQSSTPFCISVEFPIFFPSSYLMDSPCRASQSSLSNYGETNGSIPLHPQPLNVAPISCVPYTGPPLPYGYHADSVLVKVSRTSSSKHINSQQHAGGQPKMVFFPACPAREEWGNLINHANGGVALTGSALLGKVGPLLGLVDIAESEDAYVFRFSLPGVAKDEKVFHCDAGSNGKIIIKGVSMTGESKVCWKNMVFKMHTQNLCPPGEFTVSFQLPDPIDHRNLSCDFGSDGIFEGIVKKNNRSFNGQ